MTRKPFKFFGIEFETTAGETMRRAYDGEGETDEEKRADATARMQVKYPGATVKSIWETRTMGFGGQLGAGELVPLKQLPPRAIPPR